MQRPTSFNFATDVVDHYAANPPPNGGLAMHWVSEDRSEERRLTFEHFSVESHRIAILLREKLNVKPGEKLVIITPRFAEWWSIATACLRCGVVICPATSLLVDKDIEYRCRRSRASVFIGDHTSVQKLLNVRANCPHLRHIVQIDQQRPREGDKKNVHFFEDLLASIPASARFSGPKPPVDAPSMIYFTSGTTGNPKMVQHNQLSYPYAHALTGKHFLRLTPGKLFWVLSEQGWAKAAWAWLAAWNSGAGLFVHEDRRPFSATIALENLHEYPITTFCAPPTAYRQLVLEESRAQFSQYPPKALEHCTGAGEPLNPEVIRLWKQTSGLDICDGYGQTETICVCGNFEGSPIRPGSMGKPTPSVPLAIVDSNGNECAVGEEGDIAVRVDSGNDQSFMGMFDGYVTEDGHLERTLRNNKWYLTGDRATRDSEGYFWFVGRSDDVINSSGYRIGPFEVESTLKEHVAVVESAVVSSPDPNRGEVVKAFVVLTTQGAKRDPVELAKELQEFCKKNAAPYKYPRKIQFVPPNFLPKTVSGKIQRKKLKEMEWSPQQRSNKL